MPGMILRKYVRTKHNKRGIKMCQYQSYIVTQSDVHRCRDDRHENGISDLKLSDKSIDSKFVRIEIVPQWGIKKINDLSSWEFRVDQDNLPDWWNAKEAEIAVRESLKKTFDPQKTNVSGELDLNGLTSLAPGCLPNSVGGYLDLRGLTSLANVPVSLRVKISR